MSRHLFNFYLLFVSILLSFAMGNTPRSVSTFECISLYWSPEGGNENSRVLLRYREEGSEEWREGLPMLYNPIAGTTKDLADYRGSLVNLTPDTRYEIELSLENSTEKDTIFAKTWTEDFPIAKTIKVGDRSKPLILLEGGSPDGYILYEGTGSTIDVGDSANYCVYIVKDYVIVRGFTLKNATQNGIFLKDCHDVIIENCDISGWGEEDNNGWGKDYQSAVYSNSSTLKRVVVQRCKLHNPRWDTNSWDELNDGDYHPSGPQAISFENSSGNLVIRYNSIWSDDDHMFNDIFGGGGNTGYEGMPVADSDIYGNYISHCYDDAIQAEGGDRNVRVWGNYFERAFMTIANACVTIGPLYVWENVTGITNEIYSSFIKMGFASDASYMKGYTYLFHNTILQPEPHGYLGIGKSSRIIRHCITRNNVLHVPDGKRSIAINEESYDYDYDYDLCSGSYPSGQEAHGIDGIPTYIDGAHFDRENLTANFFLKETSLGYDAGVIIPNFSDEFNGDAPDMGAFEAGNEPTEYGADAYIVNSINEKSNGNSDFIPSSFKLSQNYPNPFNPSTEINFSLFKAGHVKLSVYDILGRECAVLVDGYYQKGNYNYTWRAKNAGGQSLPSGVYIAKLQFGGYTETIKMVLEK